MNFTRKDRIEILSELGVLLSKKDAEYQKVKQKAFEENPWFIPANIDKAIDSVIEEFLHENKLEKWLTKYPEIQSSKRIGLIMAGNIPLVGFHDFLTVFISGHKAILKLSSKDEVLMKYLLKVMVAIHPSIEKSFEIVERLEDFDAVIATGSNNTSRYFDYYFKKYPNIIRNNRNSVAVLTGAEQELDYDRLSNDVFDYFGLGCRNVTKLYVPETFDFIPMLSEFEKRKDVNMHHKYRNNYDYNYAIYLLNKDEILISNNIILKEDPSYISRIACLHYERYESLDKVKQKLDWDADLIQCVATPNGELWGIDIEVAFGETQLPSLEDYADGVDTMKFLSEL